MNISENIMREYQEAMSEHDIEKVRQLFHAQYTHTDSDGQKKEGIDAGIEIATMYMNAFPDLTIDPINIYSIGDTVVSEFVARGTHQGRLMDFDPTGRRINLPVCDIIEVKDGKIFAEREYFDSANMMQQLGITKKQVAHT
jgi:steroid delta-isomerase-like uncharacterized protein